ncbi:MAG TPA: hypothetical protein VK586_21665 [Streptosporangiaceae bacterium]|nr:hypothetical protein [Streptosporangiaceae bacterium]
MTAEPDPVAAAAALTGQLARMSGHLARLQRSRVRDRRIVRALAASLAADVLITAGLGYDTARVNGAQHQGRASLVAGCRLANQNRAEDIAVWDTFFRLAAPPAGRTAKTRKLIAAIDAQVRVKDAPRDCAALYR